MKVSLNIVKQYVTVDVGVDELVAKINQQLGGVEEVVELPLTGDEKATFHACCEGIRHNMEHLKEI